MRAWQEVQTTTVDDVTVVLAEDGGRQISAGLTFRVGWADEPLRRRGVTHLVEHLAHAAVPSRAIAFNASVGPTETEFWARGRPAEVVAHLNAVVRGLVQPDVGELERERGVLRAEGGMSGFDLVDRRFANRGFGGRAWAEFVLDEDDPLIVRSWAKGCFTRSAAVGWSTGELPGLDLSPLPAGTAPRWPAVERPPGWAPRRHLVWDDTSVAWSGEVGSGWAGAAALSVLEERATTRLRRQLGATYAVGHGSMAIGPDARVRWIHADRSAETPATVVRDVLLGDLDELAADGPTSDELDVLRDGTTRQVEDRDAPLWLATMGATEILHGRAALGAEAVVAEWEALSARDVRDAAAELRASLLLAVPLEARPDAGALPSLDRPSDAPLDGFAYRCARRRQGKLLARATETADLRIVPDHGVSATRNGHTVTIPFVDATIAVVIDGLSVHVFDGSDRAVEACVHDDADRRTWLEPLVAALGADRVVHVRRGRDDALDRIRELAGEHLGSRVRVNGLAYIASLELRAFEEVLGLAAARHDGVEGLVLLTPDRLIFRTPADAWWIDLHGVVDAESSEGVRGGRVRLVFEQGDATLDRVRARGRAAAIADAARAARARSAGTAAAGTPDAAAG